MNPLNCTQVQVNQTWIHKKNNSLTLWIKEVFPTILVGEVYNPTDLATNAQCETISVSYQDLVNMWKLPNGNTNY